MQRLRVNYVWVRRQLHQHRGWLLAGTCLLLFVVIAQCPPLNQAEGGTHLVNQAVLGQAAKKTAPRPVAVPAPVVVPASPRFFSAASPWNTPLPANATWHSEPALTAAGHWWVNRENYASPVVFSTAGQPLVTITIKQPGAWGWPAATLQLPIPASQDGAGGSDGSLIVVSNNVAYHFFRFSRTGDQSATAVCYAKDNIITDSGFGSLVPFRGAGVRASGASGLGGIIMGGDLASGTINHALSVALTNAQLKAGFVAPAIAQDAGAASQYHGSIPMGSRIGIPPGVAMPGGLTPVGQMVWRALQTYGGFVTNRSGSAGLVADPNSTTNAQIAPLRVSWDSRHHSDLDLIVPHLQVVQY